MKITIDIGGKDYAFEMNRSTYKKLLADEEYAKLQNELSVKDTEVSNENTSALILSNMVMQEQIFYYSLTIHQPEITIDKANKLIDEMIEEYGFKSVTELLSSIMKNFTQRGEEPKKKMVMRMG